MQNIRYRASQLACLLMGVIVVGQLLGINASGASLDRLDEDLQLLESSMEPTKEESDENAEAETAGDAKNGDAKAKPKPPAPKPAAIPSRFSKISKGGMFGLPPKKRVPPPKLEGIGSDYAFIRAPNGRADIVKVGGELGGVKLLAIGINRVLIEYQGKKSELLIHNGLGGESLMPKPEEKKPDEMGPETKKNDKTANPNTKGN